jgi:hypothetical protein
MIIRQLFLEARLLIAIGIIPHQGNVTGLRPRYNNLVHKHL